jgi:hypothetical protein
VNLIAEDENGGTSSLKQLEQSNHDYLGKRQVSLSNDRCFGQRVLHSRLRDDPRMQLFVPSGCSA